MGTLSLKSDKRNLPRISNLDVPCINVSCEQNASIDPCRIINLSQEGICIISDNPSAFLLLIPGDRVNIILEGHIFPAAVARINRNIAGLWFKEMTKVQSDYIERIIVTSY
jgi:hypothetical protein